MREVSQIIAVVVGLMYLLIAIPAGIVLGAIVGMFKGGLAAHDSADGFANWIEDGCMRIIDRKDGGK